MTVAFCLRAFHPANYVAIDQLCHIYIFIRIHSNIQIHVPIEVIYENASNVKMMRFLIFNGIFWLFLHFYLAMDFYDIYGKYLKIYVVLWDMPELSIMLVLGYVSK